jgi:hypothetical protein
MERLQPDLNAAVAVIVCRRTRWPWATILEPGRERSRQRRLIRLPAHHPRRQRHQQDNRNYDPGCNHTPRCPASQPPTRSEPNAVILLRPLQSQTRNELTSPRAFDGRRWFHDATGIGFIPSLRGLRVAG